MCRVISAIHNYVKRTYAALTIIFTRAPVIMYTAEKNHLRASGKPVTMSLSCKLVLPASDALCVRDL